jgi:hypothetical protein
MSSDTMPIEAIDLFGQIVSANVASLAHTTNLIDQLKDEQIRTLAQDLVDLWSIIEAAAVIDRKTERRLWAFEHRVELALNTLETGTR